MTFEITKYVAVNANINMEKHGGYVMTSHFLYINASTIGFASMYFQVTEHVKRIIWKL
jgi:hypothetical protein